MICLLIYLCLMGRDVVISAVITYKYLPHRVLLVNESFSYGPHLSAHHSDDGRDFTSLLHCYNLVAY